MLKILLSNEKPRFPNSKPDGLGIQLGPCMNQREHLLRSSHHITQRACKEKDSPDGATKALAHTAIRAKKTAVNFMIMYVDESKVITAEKLKVRCVNQGSMHAV